MENNIKKSIEISASDDKVWNTLTRDEYVRQWANAFEGGTYVESDFTENAVVTWKNKEGRNVVKGRVEVSYPGKMLKINYFEDENAPDDAEAGAYKEHYLLSEHEGRTLFTIESGPLPDQYIEVMDQQWDEAIKLIKKLSEAQ